MTQTRTTGTIIDHLTADHEQIKALFSDVVFVRPEQRADTFCELVTELVRHEVAEEVVVFPAVRADAPDGAVMVEPRLREQAGAERMLAAMEALKPDSLEFADALTELSTAVLQHAAAEEREIFPLLRQAESVDALFELAERYEKAKASAPTHPHPHAPRHPAGEQDLRARHRLRRPRTRRATEHLNMVKAHGQAKKELERVSADPNVDDVEGTSREDTWLGRGSYGWFDTLLRRFSRQPS